MNTLPEDRIGSFTVMYSQKGTNDRRAMLCGLDDASLFMLRDHRALSVDTRGPEIQSHARVILEDREKGRQIERDLQKAAAIKAQIADLLERAEGVKLGIMDARASQPAKDAAWLELACYKALYEQAAALLVAAAGRI